ncbi:MAG: outer membrane protein transport protein [Candidatus Cloacimonetes bacterium]|nr:outer membrane protein transport protein [Candidatus Cloacimonadota bacterium]
MLKRFLFVIVILTMVSVTFAGGIALSGVGTRAKAMGGAMRGLADDASAMYWNPAGLSFLEETTLTAGIHYVDFNGEYENLEGVTYENDDLLNLIPSLVFAKNCPDKPWNWGFGIYVPFGLSAEWDMYQRPDTMNEMYLGGDINGNGTLDDLPLDWDGDMEENETFGSMMVVDFHPTFSYKFNDKFSAGIGLSIDYASIKLTKVKLHENEEMPAYSLGEYLPTFFELNGTGMTYGANYGLMYKPTECLSIGLSGRTESELTFEGDANIDVYLNNWIAYVKGLGTGENGVTVNANPDAEATIVLPGDFGGGLSYKINENWLVSADFTYTWWESVDVINIEFSGVDSLLGEPLEDEEMVLEWTNTIRFGLGTEYVMGPLAYRLGYYYDESPLNDKTMSVTFPDFSTKNALNAGLGYQVTEKLSLDFAVEYIMFEEREVDEYEDNLPGTYNGGLIDIMLDFTWKF